MAIDKAIDSAVLDANLTTVADAIRAKGGTSDPLSFPTGFADAISAIQAGGGGGGIDSSITDKYIVRSGTIIPETSTGVIFDSVSFADLVDNGEAIDNTGVAFGVAFCVQWTTNDTGNIVYPSFGVAVSSSKYEAYRTKITSGKFSGSSSYNDLNIANLKVTWKLWSLIPGATYVWIAFFPKK